MYLYPNVRVEKCQQEILKFQRIFSFFLFKKYFIILWITSTRITLRVYESTSMF